MKRYVRDSTTAKSEESNRKLKQRELDSVRRKSQKLVELAERNKIDIDEAIESAVVAQSSETDSSSREDIGGDQSEDYWYDTSNQELTSVIESPITPTSASAQDPDNWSKVNRFLPDGCVLSPSNPGLQRAASLPLLATTPTDPNFLDASDHSLDRESVFDFSDSPPSPTDTVIMAMDTFKGKLKEVKKLKEALYLLIDVYNEETVTILDKDYYRDELQNINNNLIKL